MKTIRILALSLSFGAASLAMAPAAHACDGHCACAKGDKKACGADKKECSCPEHDAKAECKGKDAEKKK